MRKNYKYPKAVFLFEEKQLSKIMQRDFGDNDFEYVKKLYGKKSKKADSLYKLVWKPLEKYLQKTKNVYISPSGMLNSVSFDAIPINKSKLLSDKYKIIFTSTTAEAVNKTGLYQKKIKNAVLFGGLTYDMLIEKMIENTSDYIFEPYNKETNTKNMQANNFVSVASLFIAEAIDKNTRGQYWTQLPGTYKEIQAIDKVLSSKKIATKIYSDDKGNEEVFKSMEGKSPEILHIATHGFYFPEPEIKLEDNFGFDNNKKLQFTDSKNPLLRSGLLLSGAQNAFSGKKLPNGLEDGVLTASEISRLNFFNTKLAVLSACQTGLGKVKGSEGVYGLQRAFKMCGVEYIIYSLWQVPDVQTKELMTNFYENWFSGMEIRVAFKKAQNYLKTKYTGVKGASYAWAAFILMK